MHFNIGLVRLKQLPPSHFPFLLFRIAELPPNACYQQIKLCIGDMNSQALPRAPRETQQGLLQLRISDEAFRLECERIREELWIEVDDRRGDPNRSLKTSGV